MKHLICQKIGLNFNLLNYPKLKKIDICPVLNEINLIKELLLIKDSDKNFRKLEITVFGIKILKVNENLKNLCHVFSKG